MSLLNLLKRNPVVLPLVVVAGMSVIFISEAAYWRSGDTIDALSDISDARSHITNLERGVADAETGQRGYLLTGRAEYLVPYNQARNNINLALQQLNMYFAKDPVAASSVAALHILMKRRLTLLEDTVRLMQSGQQAQAADTVSSGAGKRDMALIRELTTKLLAQQTKSREAGIRDLNLTLLLSRVGMATLSAVLMLALLLYLRKSDALAQQQRTQQHLVQNAHDRLELEVAQRTTQLTALTSHLLTAREDERHRLARDLHDDLGSLLTAAKLDAARVKSRLAGASPDAMARLADLVAKLDGGIALGRRIIEDLRPSTLSHLGLTATLEILMRDFSERATSQVHSQIEKVSLGPSAELVVYRVVQEAVTNLSKYAKANRVWLTVGPCLAGAFAAASPANLNLGGGNGATTINTRIAPDAPGVSVSVRDDGVGFDVNHPTQSAYGLLGMRFRVEAAGGLMLVRSSPGGGVLISVWLPAAHIENSTANTPKALG
jgi:signal transduction histidine kinase